MANLDSDHCVLCNQPWSIVQPGRRAKKARDKGNLLRRCKGCHIKKFERFDGRPYNEQDEELNPPKVQPKTVSFMSFKEEVRQLAQQSDWTQFSVVVCDLWNGDESEIRPISQRISCLIHEHTGYKFFGRSVERYSVGFTVASH
jgi:hypothetical protein